KSALEPKLHAAMHTAANTAAVDVQNAFVAGLEKSAIDTVFQNLCRVAVLGDPGDPTATPPKPPTPGFVKDIQAQIENTTLATIKFHPTCSCNVDADLKIEQFNVGPFNPQTDCTTTFSGPIGPGGQIDVTFHMPTVTATVGAHKSCED